MSEEQRHVVLFQAQTAGLALFFCKAALSVAYLGPLNFASSALPDTKITSSEGYKNSVNRP